MALAMERACFDYIMLEETLMVSEGLPRHGRSPSNTCCRCQSTIRCPPPP
jgi:hypothetical protein